MDLNLHDTDWDCCVIGNGVAALWVSHWLWSNQKSVLWITSEETYSPERALLQHGWLWEMSPEHSALLRKSLLGLDSDEVNLSSFEAVYFDARSSKRFRRFQDVSKLEWGSHEKEYFEKLVEEVKKGGPDSPESDVDFWAWQTKVHRFHNASTSNGRVAVEVSGSPRFVRVQGWPLLEIKTTENKVSGVVLAGLKPGETMEIRGREFFLADYDEPLAALIENQSDSEALSGALKGKKFRAGFGLRLWHKDLESAPSQTLVIPLTVSPEKNAGSHVAGRFLQTENGLESIWMGFLTDEELEDNNEILKKIKQSKRAIDRAIAGFAASITREAVTFEPRMHAQDLLKSRKRKVLGATLLSDHYGLQAAAAAIARVFSGQVDEPVVERQTKSKTSRTKRPAAEQNI